MKRSGNEREPLPQTQFEPEMKSLELLCICLFGLPLSSWGDKPIQSKGAGTDQKPVFVQVQRGNVVVVGWDRSETASVLRAWPEDFANAEFPQPTASELDQSPGKEVVRIQNQENRVSVRFNPQRSKETLFLWIPEDVNVKISALGGGSVGVRGTKGEIEVESLQGKVLLDQIWGPVVAHALNEDLWVRFSALVANKPNYLSSLNGDVSVVLPKDAEASFELDFFNGEVDTTIPITLVPGTNLWALDGSTVFEPSRSAETNRRGTHFRIKNHNGNIIIKDYETN